MAIGDHYQFNDAFLEEFRRMKAELRSLRSEVYKNSTRRDGEDGPVVAFGKIVDDMGGREENKPGEGRFRVWRRDETGDLSPGVQEFPVLSMRPGKVSADTEIFAGRAGTRWYVLDAGVEVAFFMTGTVGVPAATFWDQPGKQTNLLRLRFDTDTETIVPHLDPDGNPVFEDIYNMTGEAIDGVNLLQCKKINGAWFIDVEPCTKPPGI